MKSPVVPAIAEALRRGVEEGACPGAAAAVFHRGALVHLSATGDARIVPTPAALHPDARFDLASLTKVVATTAAVALLVGRGRLELDAPAARYWPELPWEQVTLRHLLAHSSGLPAWKPFFLDVLRAPLARALFDGAPTHDACARGRAMLLEAVRGTALERAPGAQAVYSDLGFIALGHLVERVAGVRLDRFVAEQVHAPLGLRSLAFRPLDGPSSEWPQLAATGICRPREPAPGQERLLPAPDLSRPPAPPGEVDDDNAFAMGGVAGHAGLFGDAHDVAAWGQAVLDELDGAARLAPAEVWRELVRRDATPGSSRALGFDTPSGENPAAGRALAGSRTIGHTGFTGTSLWIDLERRLAIALLTNRTHPSRANLRIAAFRPAFHDAVVAALE